MSKPKLQVIIASTRPGRVGPIVADWFVRLAEQHDGLEVGVTDLAELALPLLDEPHHPSIRQYQHQHTKDWSAIVDGADAFVIVMPEYNYTFTAPLKNAIDYLHTEWKYKPVGFVSYGGISGGLRAVQSLKPVVTTLSMFPLPASVALPFVANSIVDGVLEPSELAVGTAKSMLDELVRVATALKPLRENAA
ncbi:MAG TPA: NAD(P)H-dependent oxidoreductase [Jatrophihabitantaceae bacterium]|nr:NAD(P)H-dependent oxidoreductase [Jatrophihabitantaceae bacterium]